MLNFLTKNSLLGVLVGILLLPATLSANIVLQNVVGNWQNPVGGSNLQGTGSNELRWGGATQTYAQKSGYRFDPVSPLLFSVSPNVPFTLGTFTHFNSVIPVGTAISSVRLSTKVNLVVGGVSVPNLAFVFDFFHNETPNIAGQCASGATTVCDDIITIANNTGLSSTFTIDGIKYTLNVLGFSVNNVITSSYMTKEGMINQAILKAVITSTQVHAPEPSTYLLMSSLAAACLFLKKRETNSMNTKA